MARPTQPWKQRLVSRLVQLFSLFPLRLLQAMGSGFGWLVAHLPNRQRRNALINIGLCFPELPSDAQLSLRNQNMKEFGRTYFELARLLSGSAEDALKLICDVRGGELLQRAPGEGLIVLSPHLGTWELAGLYLSVQGPTTIFYRPQNYLDDMIRTARERGGATLAPTNPHGIKLLLQALNRGELIGILPDQAPRADKGAVYAPFFGIPAFTMLLVNRLLQKSNVRAIFMFAERLPKAKGYRIHCEPAPTDMADADPVIAAQALNKGVENCIRISPEQYLWQYRRFRRLPDPHISIYDGPLSNKGTLAYVATLQEALAKLPQDC